MLEEKTNLRKKGEEKRKRRNQACANEEEGQRWEKRSLCKNILTEGDELGEE